MSRAITRRDPDPRGYFGEFGGRYVPETLVEPVEELERSYLAAREDPAFLDELDRLLEHYVGRPTPVSEARRLSAAFRGARVFLKREDLAQVILMAAEGIASVKVDTLIPQATSMPAVTAIIEHLLLAEPVES